METLKLNETPIRTSRNFNINNIALEDIQIPEKIGKFNNVEIIGKNSKNNVDSNIKGINVRLTIKYIHSLNLYSFKNCFSIKNIVIIEIILLTTFKY